MVERMSVVSQSGPPLGGDLALVKAATRKLFSKLTCNPGPGSGTVDDSWKTAGK